METLAGWIIVLALKLHQDKPTSQWPLSISIKEDTKTGSRRLYPCYSTGWTLKLVTQHGLAGQLEDMERRAKATHVRLLYTEEGWRFVGENKKETKGRGTGMKRGT